MSAQTTYKFRAFIGAAGNIVDLAPHAIATFLNEEANGDMKFGVAVVDGTAAGYVKLPTATTNKLEGITVNNLTTENDLDGSVRIINKAAVGVMRYGNVYGRVATGVTPAFGDKVYALVSGDEKGFLTNSASGTLPLNARFISSVDNGVAQIELQQLTNEVFATE